MLFKFNSGKIEFELFLNIYNIDLLRLTIFYLKILYNK